MAECVLTQDMNLDCRDSVGGLRQGNFIEFGNVTALTITAGVVTGITKAIGKKFFKYQFPRETAFAKSVIQGNEQNGSLYFNHELKIVVNKLDTQKRNEIFLLAKNRLMFVGEDMNGKFWLLGRGGGILVSGGEIGTGTAAGDRSGADLDFAGVETEPMIEVDSATALTLLTAGV